MFDVKAYVAEQFAEYDRRAKKFQEIDDRWNQLNEEKKAIEEKLKEIDSELKSICGGYHDRGSKTIASYDLHNAKYPLYPGTDWLIITAESKVTLQRKGTLPSYRSTGNSALYGVSGKRLVGSSCDAPEKIDINLAKEVFEAFNKLLPPS